MWIMRGNQVVAKPFRQNDMVWGLRREYGLTCLDTPIDLFGFKSDTVTLQQFYAWAETRCCPPTRPDIQEVLASFGLKEYDALAIVKQTKGVLPGVDDFWIDFTKW